MPQDYAKIKNTQERRAMLAVEMMEDRALHVTDIFDEPPPGTQEPTPQQVREIWMFSPYRERGPVVYWTLYSLSLDKLMGEIAAMPGLAVEERVKLIRQAHQKSEMAGLMKTYPHRAQLIQLGITTPERSIQLAERARRLAEQDSDQDDSGKLSQAYSP